MRAKLTSAESASGAGLHRLTHQHRGVGHPGSDGGRNGSCLHPSGGVPVPCGPVGRGRWRRSCTRTLGKYVRRRRRGRVSSRSAFGPQDAHHLALEVAEAGDRRTLQSVAARRDHRSTWDCRRVARGACLLGLDPMDPACRQRIARPEPRGRASGFRAPAAPLLEGT